VTLSKTVIRAPFSGTLGLRRVSEGAWVSPSTVLATLQDTSTLKLDFTLPERYGGLVALGSEFQFKVSGSGETYKGKVLAQEPIVDKQTRSILVRGVVEQHQTLLPGTFATVDVPLRTEQALLIPAIAVVPDVEGRRVFVLQDGTARGVPVEIGARTSDRVQILSGLKPGDQVVVSNLLRMRNGAKVKLLGAGRP
jgi:membrane fusion protein (multidrug efflux system)